MTSSVRGLYVGGRSTGTTNRQSSRRTAPVAAGQGSAAPLEAQEKFERQRCHHRRQCELQCCRQSATDSIKSIRFPDCRLPPEQATICGSLQKPWADLATALARLLTRGSNLKSSEKKTQSCAESLAAQGLQYGAFGDYAELTRNLSQERLMIPTVLQTIRNAHSYCLQISRQGLTGLSHTSAARLALFRFVKTQ